MFRKWVSFILILAMVFPVNTIAFALDGSDTLEPYVESADPSNWNGEYPLVGQSGMLVVFKGSNLLGTPGIRGVLYEDNGGIYTEVGSSTVHQFIGVDENGKEMFLMDIPLDSGGNLEAKSYYIDFLNTDEVSIKNNGRTFLWYPSEPMPGYIGDLNVKVFVSGIGTLYLESVLRGFDFARPKTEFDMRLIQGDSNGEGGYINITEVGTLDPDTFALDMNLDGTATAKGSFSMSSALNPDMDVLVEVIAPGLTGNTETAWSTYNQIDVVEASTASLNELKILNAYSAQGFGHGEISATYFVGQNEAQLEIDFNTVNTPDDGLLTVKVIQNEAVVGSVSGGVLTKEVQSNGFSRYSGTVQLSESLLETNILRVEYDQATIGEIVFNASTVVGVESLYVDGQSPQFDPPYFKLYDACEIKLELENALNIDMARLSGKLINSADANDTIDLSVSGTREGGNWDLIFTPETAITTTTAIYKIDVQQDGSSLRRLYYTAGVLSANEQITPDYTFEFQYSDTTEPILLDAENVDNSLTLSGRRFASSRTYGAELIKHVDGSLTAAPFQLSASFVDENTLQVDQALTDSLPRGWYTLRVKEDGNVIKGYEDIVLYTAGTASDLVLPTVSINNGDAETFDPTVTIDITPGSFVQFKYAESDVELSAMGWQAVTTQVTYEMSPEIGEKTLHFLFKTDSGFEYAMTETILLRSTSLEDLLDAGIMNAETVENVVYLNEGNAYTFYLTTEYRDFKGFMNFLNVDGDVVQTVELTRTSSSGGSHTYTRTMEMDSTYSYLNTIEFYVEDMVNSLRTSSLVIEARVQSLAFIDRIQTDFEIVYKGDFLIVQNSDATYKFRGNIGYTGSAVLTYVNDSGDPDTILYPLTEADDVPGLYQGTFPVPNDAVEITSVEYTLQDPVIPGNKATKIEAFNRQLTGSVLLTGLPNSEGAFNGTTFSVTHYLKWLPYEFEITGNQTEFEINELEPLGLYNVAIEDESGVYFAEYFSVESGKTTTINLSGSDTPAVFDLTVLGLDATLADDVRFYYLSKFNGSKIYFNTEDTVQGFVIGDTITIGAAYSDKALRVYESFSPVSMTLSQRLNEMDLYLEKLDQVTLSGIIRDARIQEVNLDACNITLEQVVVNGSKTFKHIVQATSDEDGAYALTAYPGTPMTITASRSGYNAHTETMTIGESKVHHMALELVSRNRIRVNAFSRPVLNEEDPLMTDQLSTLDLINVNGFTIVDEAGNKIFAYFKRSEGSLDLLYDRGLGNQKVYLYPQFMGKESEAEFYEVQLDAYQNGSVDVVAIPSGELSAEVEMSDGNAPLAYLLLYNDEDMLEVYMESPGFINTSGIRLEEGDYQAIFLKGIGLDKLAEYKQKEAFYLLDLNEGTQYIEKSVTIENGRIDDLGVIDLTEIVSADVLGTSESRFSTRFVPNATGGETRVLAQVYNPEISEEKQFVAVYIHTNGTLLPDSSYLNGEKLPGSGSSGYLEALNKQFNLYFSILPSPTEKTYASLRITYSMDGRYIYEMITIDDLDVPELTLNAPEEVLMGDAAKAVFVRGIGKPESRIEIYDNNLLVGEVEIPEDRNNYSTTISLTDPGMPMGHQLYAKMILEDEEITTVPIILEVIDPDVMAYTSHFEFKNGYRSLYNESPSDSSELEVFSYNPGSENIVTFRINNLLSSELEYVAFINSFDGRDEYYEASHVEDVVTETERYSKWTVTCRISRPGKLSTFYVIKESTALGALSGTKPIDFEKAIETPYIDPAYVPTSVLNSTGRTIENDDYHLKIVVPVEGGGHLKLEGEFKDSVPETPADLMAMGFVEFNTLQGKYWSKESLDDSGDTIVYRRTMYFSPELTAILKGETAVERSEARLFAQAYQADYRVMGIWDSTLSMADYTGYLYNLMDFTASSGGNTSGFGIGGKMQVLGGAVFVAQALSGPTSKDDETLYQAASKIENSDIRWRIQTDIRAYAKARRSTHTVSTILNGASFGAGYFGFVGKGLSYVISTGSMIHGSKTGAELDIWWDAIMRDIQNEIMLQEVRKDKKKKRPAKKDEQKDPKWKMDPSGYVFEAVESNRVEGIEAVVLHGDLSDPESFEVWTEAEEWEEVNPDYTDADGKYGWDVPEGDWQVKFNGNSDYFTSYSKAMTVPPIHEAVNIGLLSKKIPTATGVSLHDAHVEIEFSSYMQMESLFDSETGYSNIQLIDEFGSVVPLDRAEILVGFQDTHYKDTEAAIYQQDFVDSDYFVKRLALYVDLDAYPGGIRERAEDGISLSPHQVLVDESATSYSGIAMDGDATFESVYRTEKTKLSSPEPTVVSGTYPVGFDAGFTSSEAGAAIHFTKEDSQPSALDFVYEAEIPVNESMTIRAISSKLGYFNSDPVTLTYRIGTSEMTAVDTPVVNKPSGTYTDSVSITLTTATPGAEIRYTLDGRVPMSDSNVYSGEIVIEESAVLKAVAFKSDYLDSNVLTVNYAISSSSPVEEDSSPTETADEESTIVFDQASQVLRTTLTKSQMGDTLVFNMTANQELNLLSRIEHNTAKMVELGIPGSLAEGGIKIQLNTAFMKAVSEGSEAYLMLNGEDFKVKLDWALLASFVDPDSGRFSIELIETGKSLTVKLVVDGEEVTFEQGSLWIAILSDEVGLPGSKDGRINAYSYSADGYNWFRCLASETIAFRTDDKEFEDVDGQWFEEAVGFVADRKLFMGTGDTVFSPTLGMTRGMIAVVLNRLSVSEPPKPNVRLNQSFEDVQEGSYYENAIQWAYKHGIVSGKSDTRFDPDAQVTREELAKMIYEYNLVYGNVEMSESVDLNSYKDVDQVSDWASKALQFALDTGIIQGMGEGVLNPKGIATRAEVATMIKRMIEMTY